MQAKLNRSTLIIDVLALPLSKEGIVVQCNEAIYNALENHGSKSEAQTNLLTHEGEWLDWPTCTTGGV